MGAFQNFLSWLKNGDNGSEYAITSSTSSAAQEQRLNLKMLTIISAVGYLSAGLSMCNWRTFWRGEEERGEDWYLLNLAPNPNQNKTEWINKLVTKLAIYNEAVIFERNGGLWIADNWTVEEHGTGATWYLGVSLDNDEMPPIDLPERDVMHLRMSWIGLGPMLSQVASEYESLITIAASGYERQASEKGILQVGALAQTGVSEKSKEYEEKLFNSYFKNYFSSRSSVLALRNGYTYVPQNPTARNTSELNDVANLTDEWAERVGLALRVPPTMLKGNAENTSHAMSELITYGIRPLADQIQSEYIRKRLGAAEFRRGSRLLIDPVTIQMADLASLATTCDKLISCGLYSVNELRVMRGELALDDPEANKHYITKNYAPMGGGDEGNGGD